MASDDDQVNEAKEGIELVRDLASSPKKEPKPSDKKPTRGGEFDSSDVSDEDGGNVDDELAHAKARRKELEGKLYDPKVPGRINPGVASERLNLDEKIESLEKRKMLSGCSGPAIGATIMAILVAILLGVVAVNLLGDDSPKCTTKAAGSGVGTGEMAAAPSQDDCAEDVEAGAGDGDLSGFAGHYVLTDGLDNPNGHDTQPLDPGAYDISVQPSSASFDVDERGTITGGEIRTSFVGTGDPGACTWILEGDQASGTLALTGPGASGQLTYTGEINVSGPCSTGTAMPATRIARIGIVGNDVVLCYIAMGPDLTSCSADDPGVAGRFTRR